MEGVKRNGVFIGARKILNFIEGTNITIDIDDDPSPDGNNDIDITINSTGGGSTLTEGIAMRQNISAISETSFAEPVAWMWSGNTPTGTAWPLANKAIGIPFQVTETVTAYTFGAGTGATAGGNFDIAIYSGTTRVVSLGSTARTASAWTTYDIADTVLSPGTLYYLAMAADGVDSYSAWATTQVYFAEACGIVEALAAFPLPNPITWTLPTGTFVPAPLINLRSVAV